MKKFTWDKMCYLTQKSPLVSLIRKIRVLLLPKIKSIWVAKTIDCSVYQLWHILFITWRSNTFQTSHPANLILCFPRCFIEDVNWSSNKWLPPSHKILLHWELSSGKLPHKKSFLKHSFWAFCCVKHFFRDIKIALWFPWRKFDIKLLKLNLEIVLLGFLRISF